MNAPYIPECDSPILLINRSALNHIRLGGHLLDKGEIVSTVSMKNVFEFPLSVLYDFYDGDLSRYVVRNGRYEDYLFMLAPCNYCLLCRQKKQNEFVWRAAMEQAMFEVPPYFFTLTYSNEHLPYHGELRYKDVQNFFKRLRRMWDKKGLKHNIRYIVSGEYGSKYGRPHYHVILFNNPYGASEQVPLLHRSLEHDIFQAWGMMEWRAYDFGQCHGGAVSYATKYLSKSNPDLHGHWTKPFVHSSCGHGGIGSALIDSKKDYMHQNLSCDVLQFKDFNGNLQSVHLGSYTSNRLYPSPIRCVPSQIKSFYKQYCDILTLMVRMKLITYSDAYDLSEVIRPYKSAVPNRFTQSSCRQSLYHCSTSLKLIYAPLFNRVLSEIGDLLSVVDDVDEKYLLKYYERKDILMPQINKDLGVKRVRAREKKVISELKEKL